MGERYWRAAEPKAAYDVVIVGAGGHGLATAFYLAVNHGVTDVCVIDKGWLGGGNMARNTTIIRSNYLWDESAAIYEHSLKLWEGLQDALDFDVQFSQRGVLNLAHDLGDVRSSLRRAEANRLNGVDAEWLDADGVKAFAPVVNVSPDVRYPVLGGTLQRRGGVARHDRVAWGYARAADRLGVDIVEHAEVTGFVRGASGSVEGVETSRGTIRAGKVALAAAGHTSVLASMVDLRLPVQSHPLQALVSTSPDVRYPVLGATLQRRGGVARHDKVAWGYARGADRLGVDIVEHAEVTGFLRGAGGRVEGVETSRGTIRASSVALAAAGHTSVLASMVGLRLPVQSHPLQALVSALYEPVLGCVVMSNAVHVYVSQADKGELVMGAGVDAYIGYGQRGSFHVIEHQMAAALELFPMFAHASVLRTWGGIVDVCPDASPIVDRTPIDGLFVNCGWGTGGFKGTPGSGWIYAETIANGDPGPLAKPFSLARFTSGALIDEHGAAAVAH